MGAQSFEEALVLDPEHEDALAGLGETLLKFGQHPAASRTSAGFSSSATATTSS